MKFKLIHSLFILGISATVLHGQGMGSGNGPGESAPPMDMPVVDMPEVDALKTEFETLRDALKASREAVIEALGEDATTEDRMEALSQWKEDNEATIAEVKAAGEELRELLKSYRPDRPDFNHFNEDIKAERDALKEARQALNEARRAVVEALGEEATQEEIEAAIDAWKVENEAEIDLLKEQAKALHETFKENRPDRPGREMTQAMREEMDARRAAFREAAEILKAARDVLEADLDNPELTQEQRELMIKEFREANKDLHKEIKDLRREGRGRG